jgi:hypothetical protein
MKRAGCLLALLTILISSEALSQCNEDMCAYQKWEIHLTLDMKALNQTTGRVEPGWGSEEFSIVTQVMEQGPYGENGWVEEHWLCIANDYPPWGTYCNDGYVKIFFELGKPREGFMAPKKGFWEGILYVPGDRVIIMNGLLDKKAFERIKGTALELRGDMRTAETEDWLKRAMIRGDVVIELWP